MQTCIWLVKPLAGFFCYISIIENCQLSNWKWSKFNYIFFKNLHFLISQSVVRRDTLKRIFLVYWRTKPNIKVSNWLYQTKMHITHIVHQEIIIALHITLTQDLVKGAILCFRNPYFYFWHGESTSTRGSKLER